MIELSLTKKIAKKSHINHSSLAFTLHPKINVITSIDMKKEISKLSTALLILTLLSNAALAQTDYAVRINGDTLKGSL